MSNENTKNKKMEQIAKTLLEKNKSYNDILSEYFKKNLEENIIIENNKEKDNNEEHHFKAKVIEVHNGYIIVEPNEDEEERKSSDRFHIDNKNNASYKEGQILAITYIGGINESYPAQIGVTNISIIESN